MTQPQTELFDLYRAGWKSAADLMKTSFESAGRLQNQQFVAMLSLWSDWVAAASENQREAMQRAQETARSWIEQATKAGEPRA